MSDLAWAAATAGALGAFFFLRGFVRGAKQNDLIGQLHALVRSWQQRR